MQCVTFTLLPVKLEVHWGSRNTVGDLHYDLWSSLVQTSKTSYEIVFLFKWANLESVNDLFAYNGKQCLDREMSIDCISWPVTKVTLVYTSYNTITLNRKPRTTKWVSSGFVDEAIMHTSLAINPICNIMALKYRMSKWLSYDHDNDCVEIIFAPY